MLAVDYFIFVTDWYSILIKNVQYPFISSGVKNSNLFKYIFNESAEILIFFAALGKKNTFLHY